MKKFTLIELIISIVVLGILLAIVLVNLNPNKKQAVQVSVQSNIKLIQTAVDAYFLQGEHTLPTINQKEPTLLDPSLIDIGFLVDKGFIKKDLENSFIRNQYYWLDAYGTVWGATKPTISNVTTKTNKVENQFSFTLDERYVGYKVYKISDKNLTYNEIKQLKFTADNNKNIYDKKHELVLEEKFNSNEEVLFTIPFYDDKTQYLVSGIDEYGLETVPVGLNSSFQSILNKEGVYYYEIDSLRKMYFSAFWEWVEKPGNSSVTYRFAIKEKLNGGYGQWLNSFDEVLALEKGFAIKVEITLKGDNEGNYPSIHDLHILYTFKKGETPISEYCFVNPNGCTPVKGICEIYTYLCEEDNCNENGCDLRKIENEDVGLLGNSFIHKLDLSQLEEGERIPLCSIFPQLCIVAACDISEGNLNESSSFCFEITKNNDNQQISYTIILKENEKLSSFDLPNKNKELVIKYNIGNSYVLVNDISEIPSGSTVILTYPIDNSSELPTPPKTCEVDKDCPKTCEELNICPKQNQFEDPYVTVGELKFFGHSAIGENTKWINYTSKDTSIEGKTKVVYKFATGSRGGYGSQSTKFPENELSESITAHIYLQIHKSYLNEVEPPKVTEFKFITDKGEELVNLYNAHVEIYFYKNNNKGRSTISDTSIVDWNVYTYDPNGLEIIDTRWAKVNGANYEYFNPKGNTYNVGKHTIAVQVQNENGDWSNWNTYTFNVLAEKPTVKIKATTNGKSDFKFVNSKNKIEWSYTATDEDGDKITKVEWDGVERNESYSELGINTVRLRVQDEEGNRSDWDIYSFEVIDSLKSITSSQINIGLFTDVSSNFNNNTVFQSNTSKEKVYYGKDSEQARNQSEFNSYTNYGNKYFIYLEDFKTNSTWNSFAIHGSSHIEYSDNSYLGLRKNIVEIIGATLILPENISQYDVLQLNDFESKSTWVYVDTSEGIFYDKGNTQNDNYMINRTMFARIVSSNSEVITLSASKKSIFTDTNLFNKFSY